MTDTKLTGLTELATPADDDLCYLVDVDDLTDSAAGSSRKVQAKNLRGWPITAAETAAAISPTNYQYEPGNVLRYGTNTVEGTTDMSTAIQAAIDTFATEGGTVVVPKGTYLIGSVLTIPDPIRFIGDGYNATVLKPSANSMTVIDVTDNRAVLESFTIDSNSKTGITGINCTGSQVLMSQVRTNGIATGIKLDTTYNCVVRDSVFLSTTLGIDLVTGNQNQIIACGFNSNTGIKISGTSPRQNRIRDCDMESSIVTAIILEDALYTIVDGNWIESCSADAIIIRESAGSADFNRILYNNIGGSTGDAIDIQDGDNNIVSYNRTNNNATGVKIGAGCNRTVLELNDHSDTALVSDSGTDTVRIDAFDLDSGKLSITAPLALGTTAGAGIYFDANRYFQLQTGGTLKLAGTGLQIQGTERSDPTAPAANAGIVYFKDNGSGKTQLVVRFNTGAVQVLATEP